MTDLPELFARDPRKYSKQDIQEIIRALREMRERFQAGDKRAGNTKTKPPLPDLKDLEL